MIVQATKYEDKVIWISIIDEVPDEGIVYVLADQRKEELQKLINSNLNEAYKYVRQHFYHFIKSYKK